LGLREGHGEAVEVGNGRGLEEIRKGKCVFKKTGTLLAVSG